MKRLLRVIIITVITVIITVTFISFIFEKLYPYPADIKYGVTFSPGYARYLKLDWQKTYIQILDELKVKNLRLPSYWDTLEKTQGKDVFSEIDFMLAEAAKRGVKVMLVVGARQPRWPECHYPAWAKQLSILERQKKTLELIQKVIERYQDNNAVWAWQVENEPFAFWFGENCDPPNLEFLRKEVALVKKLDSSRPVIVTDSGELSLWIDSITASDILGISVYRKSFNSALDLYINYPTLPGMYRLKAYLVRQWLNYGSSEAKRIIVSELQAEPWLSDKDAREGLPARQNKLFSLDNFKENIIYAKKTGFDEIYLWGVEWWYFMADNGHPEYLEYAKTLFR